jgi:hypothetical protein
MKRTLLLSIACLILAGCATTANYEKMLDTWVGAPELELVRSWGPPIRSYETSGRKFLVYQSNRNVVIRGTAPSYTTTFVGNTAFINPVGGSPSRNVEFKCQTTFELSEAKVVSWRYEGNDCKSQAGD